MYAKDFLLSSDTARRLYENYARSLPVIDYHCHLNPREIAEDKRYDNIAQVMLGSAKDGGDHYKWRLMRTYGIQESLITGNGDDYQKWLAWAEVLPHAIGNPVYLWTHMELRDYFGFDKPLNPSTAKEAWDVCNKKLKTLTAREMIRQAGVMALCTSDDPADNLKWHEIIKNDASFTTQVLPTFRPDKVLAPDTPDFKSYLKRLGMAAGIKIKSLGDLLEALKRRMDYFDAHGCVVADQSMMEVPTAIIVEDEDDWEMINDDLVFDDLFEDLLADDYDNLDEYRIFCYRLRVISFLATEYKKRRWVMCLHYGVQRNVNENLADTIGPNIGGDVIAGTECGAELADFLSELDYNNALPKTIIFSLNPNDNRFIDSIVGAFQEEGVKAKIQHGAAWWFNDTRSGMRDQMISLAETGLLGCFLGMLTDSRSFTAYTRHDYFRRVLCDLIAEWIDRGEYFDDEETLKRMIEGICYKNVIEYFELAL
ncbi:MAG: glucuronate isomerase [Clostridiales bacterium]|jgi:glucuronate isomerase|nr:glucuronate isomerase [Clostridiales bacterium]